MARHGEILDSFKQNVDNFDFTNHKHVTCVCMHYLPKVVTVDIQHVSNILQRLWGKPKPRSSNGQPSTLTLMPRRLNLFTRLLGFTSVMFEDCCCVSVQLKLVLIKCCDISNEVRPTEVAEPWLDCLLEEYFMQVSYCFFENDCQLTHHYFK